MGVDGREVHGAERVASRGILVFGLGVATEQRVEEK